MLALRSGVPFLFIGVVISELITVSWEFYVPYFLLVPVLAMTATANLQDQEYIKDSLCLKSCRNVGNPDRKNIYYEKCFRRGQEIDSVEGILYPIGKGLLKDRTDYPLTVIYIPLRWCGYAYKLFESLLGIKQY
jgi:hypothetical protein